MAKKRFSADYTAGDILQLYEERKSDGDEARLRTLAPQFRELCRMEHKVDVPEQYKEISKEVRTPFVRDSWHRITSSLVSKPPVCHVTPRDDDNQDYREAANIAERFDLAMIERINKERGSDIIYNLTSQLVRDGESVLKVVHRPDAWANFPTRLDDETADEYNDRVKTHKRGADLPIAWKDVDRLSVVYEGGEYGDEWVIEYGEYAKPYLKAKYKYDPDKVTPSTTLSGKPMPEGMATTTKGRMVKAEFFTAKEWHVLINGEEAPGFPKKNPYSPYLPYFRAPAHELESLLYSLLFLAPTMDTVLTMKLVWGILGAYPNPVIETVPNSSGLGVLDGPLGNAGDAAGDANKVVWKPGKVIDLPIGKTIKFLAPPAVGADLDELIQILKSLIDIAGIPSIMRGVSGSGDSGYLANQLRAAAETAYKLATLSLQRQLEKAVEFSHWLVPNVVKQTVFVMGWDSINSKSGKPTENASRSWLGLSPDDQTESIADVSKLGPVSFAFRSTLPTDEQARAMIALQLTNSSKPLYDRRHALETWMQEEDPEAILDALYVEEAMEQPALKNMMMQHALAEAGIGTQQTPQQGGPVGGQTSGLAPVASGPISAGMQGGAVSAVPQAQQSPPGVAGVPGLTMPLQPRTPQSQGIPGNPGGREAGTYPGRPGGAKK